MSRFHGPQDRRKKDKSPPPTRRGRPLKWQDKSLGRADRVITFLEGLPITKGVLAGLKMKLLPGQRQFVNAIYGNPAPDGRRQIRLAIKSEPRGNGKTGLLAGLALCHCRRPSSSRK